MPGARSVRARLAARLRPKAMFWRTLSQGNSALCWKTTPRSGPGRFTALPPTSTAPLVGCSKPATRFSSVDFPQPLAPTMATNSLCATRRSASASAVMRVPRDSKTFATRSSTTSAIVALQPVPLEHAVAQEHDDAVGEETQDADAEHRRDHDVV